MYDIVNTLLNLPSDMVDRDIYLSIATIVLSAIFLYAFLKALDKILK